MKKALFLLTLFLLLAALPAPALGTEPAPTVYVSIADDTGTLVLARSSIPLTDRDGDGVTTLHDALACAHDLHPQGAEAYSVTPTQWGLSLMKLWGVENGGSYAYYLNDRMANSLMEPVTGGDSVAAFAFTDLVGFTDTYCFFTPGMAGCRPGEALPVTLSVATFDEAFAPVTLPVAGAQLLVNGLPTQWVTDAQGNAVLCFETPGTYTVTAASDAWLLVPTVCLVTVSE